MRVCILHDKKIVSFKEWNEMDNNWNLLHYKSGKASEFEECSSVVMSMDFGIDAVIASKSYATKY